MTDLPAGPWDTDEWVASDFTPHILAITGEAYGPDYWSYAIEETVRNLTDEAAFLDFAGTAYRDMNMIERLMETEKVTDDEMPESMKDSALARARREVDQRLNDIKERP